MSVYASALDARLHAQLATLAPGRRLTAAGLGGFLATREDPGAIEAALARLHAQRLATVEIEHKRGHRPVRWWGP